MNNGAFGENFPYSNFHDLNMDWIITTVKDFLDKYTQIDQAITDGLNDLNEKAEQLEALLQAWYDTHSEDIATQLANALSDLNTWYTQHEGYLDQYVASSIAEFNSSADAKGAQVLASIPSDYTAMSKSVNQLSASAQAKDGCLNELVEAFDIIANRPILPFMNLHMGAYYNHSNNTPQNNDNYCYSDIMTLGANGIVIEAQADTVDIRACYYNSSQVYTHGTLTVLNTGESWKWFPNTVDDVYVRFSFNLAHLDKIRVYYEKDNRKVYLFTQFINMFHLGDITKFLTFRTNFYAEWNTGTIKKSDTWGYYTLPITKGVSLKVNGASPTGWFMTFYKNGTYVSGELVRSAEKTWYFNDDSIDTALASFEQVSYQSVTVAYSDLEKQKTIYVGTNEEYTRLIDALNYAHNHKNTTVRVRPGTYDLVEELGGTEYINTHSMGTGTVIDNGIKLIFDTGAKVKLNYSGTNTDFMARYSPFTARLENGVQTNGDFYIENLDIEASNVKYCFHDDMGFSSIPYIHKFVNCRMKLNNSLNTESDTTQCIGGGFGRYGEIDIVGGEYYTTARGGNANPEITYHACAEQIDLTQYSILTIKDAILEHTCIGRRYGFTTAKSIMYVTNCNLGTLPSIQYEQGVTDWYDNIILKQWNNFIR